MNVLVASIPHQKDKIFQMQFQRRDVSVITQNDRILPVLCSQRILGPPGVPVWQSAEAAWSIPCCITILKANPRSERLGPRDMAREHAINCMLTHRSTCITVAALDRHQRAIKHADEGVVRAEQRERCRGERAGFHCTSRGGATRRVPGGGGGGGGQSYCANKGSR